MPRWGLHVEDYLFIEPESRSVDTNLMLDFTFPRHTSEGTFTFDVAYLVLADRGGLASLDQPYPDYSYTNTQRNSQL